MIDAFCSPRYSSCGGIGPGGWGGWGLYDYDEDYSIFGSPPPAVARGEARHVSMLNKEYDAEAGRYRVEVRVQLLDEKGKNLVHEVVMQNPTLERVLGQMKRYANKIGQNQIEEKVKKEGLLKYITLTPYRKGFTFTVNKSEKGAAKKIEDFLNDPARFSKSTSKLHYLFHYDEVGCGNGGCVDYRSRKGYMKSGSMQIVYNSRSKEGYIDVDKYAAHGSGILQTLGHGLEVLGGGLPSVPRVRYRGFPPPQFR